MIFTQTYAELGMPNMTPLGVFEVRVEPTDKQGYGKARADCLDELFALAEEKLAGDVLLKAVIETTPGSAHPSYGRRRYFLRGDRYRAAPDALPALSEQRHRFLDVGGDGR